MKYLTVTCLIFFLMLSACHREQAPVVVHVFRDREGAIGKNIDSAIRAVGLHQIMTADGSPIMIATLEFRNYRDGLAAIRAQQPDIVILDSRADLPPGNLGDTATDLNCASNVKCVAVIPSWTRGKTREAAEHVLKLITANLPQS